MSDLSEKMKKYNSKIDACIWLGEKTEKLYKSTKNRKGLYKVLNWFVFRLNNMAYKSGYKYLRKQNDWINQKARKIKIAQ